MINNKNIFNMTNLILVHMFASGYYMKNTRDLGTPFWDSLTERQRQEKMAKFLFMKKLVRESMMMGLIVSIIFYYYRKDLFKDNIINILSEQQENIRKDSAMVRGNIFKDGIVRGILLLIILRSILNKME